MTEKQPTSYVVCRYRITRNAEGYSEFGDNIPVKVFDTRKEARAYCNDKKRRAKKYGFTYYAVKQG